MEIPRFFYCENKKELPGAGLILHTDPPCYIAKVFRFEKREDMDAFIKKYQLEGKCGKINGYYIIICYIGNIDRIQPLPIRGEIVTEKITAILKMMVSFYYDEKVLNNESRLKRNKE